LPWLKEAVGRQVVVTVAVDMSMEVQGEWQFAFRKSGNFRQSFFVMMGASVSS
jgi:hypothetical protein